MNQKERLLGAMQKKPVDRAPFICPGGMMTMVMTEVMETIGCTTPEIHSDPNQMAALTLGVRELAGVENLGVPFCMTIEAEGMGSVVDLGSGETEPRVTEYAIKSFEEVDTVGEFRPNEGRAKACVEAIRILKERAPDAPVVANITGPVSLATSLIDPMIYYRAIRKDKEPAHRLTRLATEAAKAFGDAMLEAGADLICIADPSATGELIGQPAFEEFALPYLNELFDHFRDRYAAPAIAHICGDVKSLGCALAAVSAEVVSVDSMVSITDLQEQVKGKVTMGNVSTMMLERGDAAQVHKAGVSRLRGGVNILAPACGVSPRTPVANMRSLADAASISDKMADSSELVGVAGEVE